MFNTALVKKIEDIPGFRRIYAETDARDLKFEPGGYVKIVLNEGEEKKMRSITVSMVDDKSFSLDFVAHGSGGPASRWQQDLQVGTTFQFKGPGAKSHLNTNCDHFYFYADYTGLPALHAHLQNIEKEKNVSIYFEGEKNVLNNYLRNLDFVTFDNIADFFHQIEFCSFSNSSLWAAGERLEILKIRELTASKQDDFNSYYISSYWQKGAVDEEHRSLKKKDRKI